MILTILHQNKDAEDLGLTGTVKAPAGAKLLWRGSWLQKLWVEELSFFQNLQVWSILPWFSYLANGTCKELLYMRHI